MQEPETTAPPPSVGEPPPAPPAVPSPRAALRDAVVMFLASSLLIRGVLAAKDGLGLPDDVYILPALLFILLPDIRGKLTRDPVDPQVVLPTPLAPEAWRALRLVTGVVLLIYPAFIVGNHLWQSWGLPQVTALLLDWFREPLAAFGLTRPFPPHHPSWVLPADLGLLILWHLLPVGYAEEFFYRGWMQTHLDRSFGTRWTVFGARLGPGWIWTAVLFTAGHSLVEAHWWQPFIVFPALLFGWLRARTGNILAGTLFHAFANVAMITLDTMYGLRAP